MWDKNNKGKNRPEPKGRIVELPENGRLTQVPCETCGGKGFVSFGESCSACNGNGAEWVIR